MATRKKAGVKKPAEMEAVTDEPVTAVAPPAVVEEKPAELPPIEQSPNIIYRPSRVYQYVAEREVGGKKTTIRRPVDKPTEFDKEGRLTEPPKSPVRIGRDEIPVPDAETQLKGFYSDHADRLVKAVNQYKFLKPLGVK